MGRPAAVVTIDPQSWYDLNTELKAFDPALSRALRRRIKGLGEDAVDKVRETLREPSPDTGDDSGEGRAALSAGTRVTVSFARRTAGAKIVTSPSRLPAAHKGLAAVYNKARFRHPVFGNKGTYVTQSGRPYFGAVIMPLFSKEIVKEMSAALDEGIRAIGGSVR